MQEWNGVLNATALIFVRKRADLEWSTFDGIQKNLLPSLEAKLREAITQQPNHPLINENFERWESTKYALTKYSEIQIQEYRHHSFSPLRKHQRRQIASLLRSCVHPEYYGLMNV